MIVGIAVAGGIGAAVRFLVDGAVQRRRAHGQIPLGTIVVNTSACLLIGLLTGWASAQPEVGALAGVAGTGFLGGYSTFSTASVEGARLLLAGRTRAALLHAGGMLLLGISAGWLGIVVGSALAA